MRSECDIRYARFETALGPMLAAADARGLVHLSFQEGEDPVTPAPEWRETPKAFAGLIRDVRAYLSGRGRAPRAPLGNLRGTPFQRSVWKRLRAIPFGRTRSYGDIAREIGRPKAGRAVGAACGANPVPLVIPCHRVVGSGGALTGFSCGLGYKVKLLELEGALPL